MTVKGSSNLASRIHLLSAQIRPRRNVTTMGNVTTLSTVATDFDCAMSHGQVSFPESISLISLSHLHPQISVKLKSFFSPQRANLSDTQRGGRRSLFIYLQMRKEERRGAKSLNTTILFHGWCCPLPPLLCLWSWFDVTPGPFEAGSHQFATWWGEGNWKGGVLIVRSLGAGTDDPLGALSAFVRRASHLKFPTSLRESQD